LAREALPLALLIHAPIIDPRCRDIHCPRAESHLPHSCLPIANHQSMSPLIAVPLVLLDVVCHLRLQGGRQHPPRTLPCRLIQRRTDSIPFP
jgi:hypothetical protein